MSTKIKSSQNYAFVGCLVLLALLILSPCVLALFLAFGNNPPYRPLQRRALAEQLGVEENKNYFPHPGFPANYYRDILKEDMTISKVHQTVKGYRKVLWCGKRGGEAWEIYYYYSDNDYTAMRIQIEYWQEKFIGLETEDEDWRTIDPDGCKEGRLLDELTQ